MLGSKSKSSSSSTSNTYSVNNEQLLYNSMDCNRTKDKKKAEQKSETGREKCCSKLRYGRYETLQGAAYASDRTVALELGTWHS